MKRRWKYRLLVWNWPLSWVGLLIAGGAADQDRWLTAILFFGWFIASNVIAIRHQDNPVLNKELDRINKTLNL